MLEAHITLELRDLRKRFGDTVALDGCSFEVERGSMLGFLGPNGAGKTTAMRCVFGLTTPDAGEVRWKAEPIDRHRKRRFGYMPEQRGLYPRMRVIDQLSYFGALHGVERSAARTAAMQWLERPQPRRSRGGPAGGPLARQPAASAVDRLRPARAGAARTR